MDAISKFATYFVNLSYQDIPPAAVDSAKKEVLDSLATALGGSSREGVGELVDLVKEWGGKPQSTIIAHGLRCPAPDAAQVNATMIHALDYDDGHQVGLVHIGCVAVSTCFAVAERMKGKSGREIITAMALGADFVARLALASRPGQSLITFGWHPTTLYGYLSAAAMAGRLMGLNEEKMVDALGIAYHQCAGNTQCGMDGALTKRMGPGLAARGGIASALMAERGITGCKNVLEGKAGLYNVYHGGDYSPQILTDGLGQIFEGVNIGDKPYPCCGFTHPFIDAVFFLKSKHNINIDQVEEIVAYGGDSAMGLCTVERCTPVNIVEAQFSVPWTIATALVKGKVTLEDFTGTAIKQENILAVSKKVRGELVTAMNRHGVGPGKIIVRLKNGDEYIEEVEHCLGSIERPMTFADCAAKFRECAASAIKPVSADTVEKVIDLVTHLEKLEDATQIIRLLA
jgi:2-methylcitrate dehydratase PrpD